MSRRWLLWLAAPGLLFLPLLFMPRAMFFGNSDALFYTNVLTMTTDALAAGNPFPRWFGEANAGFGSPLMMFYAPLAYLLTAFLNAPFFFLHLDPGTQLLLGIYASQVISGWAAYLWLKRDFTPPVALLGSLLFVLLPYKFIYIYLHINLAQLWALAILPLWMIAAEELIAGSRRAIGGYAFCFAGVYYAHTITLIAFGAVPAAYILRFGRARFMRNVLRLGLANALGLALCLLQAWPQHEAMEWIHAERFTSGNYSWRDNFFHIDVFLCAYYGVVALLIGVAIHSLPELKGSAQAQKAKFWIGVLVVILFLTQSASTFVYELLPPLQYLQFPAARLHSGALLAATYLICLWLGHHHAMAKLGRLAYARATLALLVAIFAVATGWRLYAIYSDPAHMSKTYLGDARTARIVSTPVSIYETRWNCIEAGRAFRLFTEHKIPAPVVLNAGQATLSDLRWSPPSQLAFHADVQTPRATLTVRQCYFPLWQATDNAEPARLFPRAPDGLISLTLPPGRHAIALRLTVPPAQASGGFASFLALLVCLELFVCGRKKPAPVS